MCYARISRVAFSNPGSMPAFVNRIPPVWRAVVLMLCSTLCIATMNATIRHLSAVMHPFEIAFFRNLFGLLLISSLLLHAGLAPLRTTKIGLHAVRAGLNLAAMLAFVMGLSLETLAKVTALSFTAPLFATLIAIVILRERARLGRWIGLFAGFLGALVILRPGLDAVSTGGLLILASSAIWAFALIDIKVLTRTDSSLTITLYAAIFQVPLSLVPAAFFFRWPVGEEWGWLALVALSGTLAQLALTQAFREADTSVVMPVDFTKLVWASFIGYFAFAEVPGLWTLLGGIVVFASVIYIALGERRTRVTVVPAQPD